MRQYVCMCVCDAASSAAVVDERRVECVIDVSMRVKEVRRGDSDVDDDVAASSTAAVKERKWREGVAETGGGEYRKLENGVEREETVLTQHVSAALDEFTAFPGLGY